MSKVIAYGNEANANVMKGIDAVANIVKVTVGPRGRNVLIREQVSQPVITNDGVTIAKAVQLKDTMEDAGAQLIIQAANKTNNAAGDGTTTTTILAQTMIHKYYEYKENNKDVNPVSVQKDMIAAADKVSDYLKSISTPINTEADIERVATISSGSNTIGQLLGSAFNQAGEYGSVTVEDSKTGLDELVSIQGMKLDIGSVTPYLLTDRTAQKSDMIDAKILITKDKLDNVADLFNVLDVCVQQNLKLLIMCDEIDFEPLNMILVNRAKGVPLNVNIIRLPGFGDLRDNLLEDLSIATGATVMGRDNGILLKDFKPEYLGEAQQIIVSMKDTIIKFKNEGNYNYLELRQNRCKELETIMNSVNDNEKEQYKRRIANLLSGICVLKVGGNSDIEIKDKKLRIEDAINSIQAAKEEGIVSGGGYSFISAYKSLKSDNNTLGEKIVYDSLLEITKQIADNSGFNGDEVLDKCISDNTGFNALSGEFENLIDNGVVNATKVDRYSVINAASVASTVITMGGAIVEENEKDTNVLQLQAPMSSLM